METDTYQLSEKPDGRWAVYLSIVDSDGRDGLRYVDTVSLAYVADTIATHRRIRDHNETEG